VTGPEDQEPDADSWSAPSGGIRPEAELARTEFRGRARTLFRRYLAAAAMGQLPDYQQAFIDRNEQQSPPGRYWLLVRLEEHERRCAGGIDDPVAAGIQPFTEGELRRLEAEAAAAAPG